jgi:hypothetical protein
MLSGKNLLVNGPLYSMFSKEGKVQYLGKLKQKWHHRKGYALQFETYETVFLRSIEKKLFFIDPPEWCDECYEDFSDDCYCCSLFTKDNTVFDSVNNIDMRGIVYSEK